MFTWLMSLFRDYPNLGEKANPNLVHVVNLLWDTSRSRDVSKLRKAAGHFVYSVVLADIAMQPKKFNIPRDPLLVLAIRGALQEAHEDAIKKEFED